MTILVQETAPGVYAEVHGTSLVLPPRQGSKAKGRRFGVRALRRLAQEGALDLPGIHAAEDAPLPEGKMRIGTPQIEATGGKLTRVWPLADAPAPEPEIDPLEEIAALKARVAQLEAEADEGKA